MSGFTDVSDNLSLPYIQPSQAQKHVTHNEGMRRLDALVQLAVVSADIAQPPATPQSGTRYIVPVDGSSGWAGQEGMLAVFEENAWRYLSPQQGWNAWVADIASHLVYDGARWQPSASTLELQNIDYLGVQTVADDTNRLAVSSAATLLTHAGAGH